MEFIAVVDITVVCGGVKADALILVEGENIVDGFWGIVFTFDGNGDITAITATEAIGHRIGIGFVGLFSLGKIIEASATGVGNLAVDRVQAGGAAIASWIAN